jgi:chitodextrinase/lysophospholipase L1-like esterase
MRNKNHSLLILFTFFLSVFSLNFIAQASPQNYKIVVLGSSTAQGSGASVKDSSWVKRYQVYLGQLYPNFSIINLAKGGFKTYNILPTGSSVPVGEYVDPERNITKALSYLPNAIIINLPSNDACAFISVATQLANYRVINNLARNSNVAVWVCTPQPINSGSVIAQAQLVMVDSVFSVFGNYAIDFWTRLVTPNLRLQDKYNAGDGTHLNDAGHRILFEQVVAKNIPTFLMHNRDMIPPSIPIGLSSANITGSGFILAWTASTDNVGVSSYDVYQNGTLITNVTTTNATISGLANANTYSMTIIAKDAAGNQSVASNPLLVTTLDTQAPTTPTSLSSSNRTGNSFTLSWTASADNVGVSSYDIYKNGTLTANAVTTSATINGLTNATTYSMTVIAKDAAGNQSAACNPLLVTTLDTQAPTTPTSLSSSNRTGSSFALSWTASTDNVGVTGYDVYKNGTFTITVNTTSATINGLTNATTYSMTIIAKDAAGNQSAACNPLLVKTLDTQAPTTPTSLSSSNRTGNSFTLSWNASTDNVEVTGYDVYKNGTLTTTVNTTSAAINGLTNATTYSMTVIAKDAAGNQSEISNPLSVTTLDTQPPSIPMDLSSDHITGSGFILEWTASADNVGVSSYDIYKNDTLTTTVNTTSAAIIGLANANTYSMTVIAKDAAGNQSAVSNPLSVTTLDTIPPSIPMDLSSDHITGSGFILAWTSSADNVGISSYDIYKNDTLTTNVNTTSVMMSGLANATSYIMTVFAKDASGNQSAASGALSVTTLDTISPSIPMDLLFDHITGSSLILAWTASTDNVGVSSYDIYKNDTLTATVNTTSVMMSGLANATSYIMTVIAKDTAGNQSAASYPLSVTTLDTLVPTAPANLSSSNITNTGFTLSWTASTDNVGIDSYDVYLNGILTTSVTIPLVTITGLVDGVKYIATVIARDAAGNISPESNELNIKTLTDLVTNSDSPNLKIYPNPANKLLYINNINNANTVILIFDLQGKQVLSKPMDSNPVDISNLRTGIYVVKLVGSGNVLITKFIKE